MERIIGTCGLVCSGCRAYEATRVGDPAALEKVLAEWRIEYNAPQMELSYVPCEGCRAEGQKCGHCAECDIRACALAKGIATCAECAGYPCERLQGFFGYVPEAKATLDGLRAAG